MDPVTAELGLTPSKVIAVHLNYTSRAAQRGRTPAHPSYFLKAPSSLAGSGDVARPEGTELLAFEGEIALVIATPAHRVPPERAWQHVGWVTAANDLGLHDLRHADRGSNLRSKSGDGYTPIGPTFLRAAELDPERLRVRTWVDGHLRQSGSTEELLFGFAELVADLSRMSTLEAGDVILTGTPAGASVVEPGQVVEVEVAHDGASTGLLRTTVATGPALPPVGAPPRVDEATRADAYGETAGDAVHGELLDRLRRLGVATLSAQLRKRGLNNVHIDGVHPARPGGTFAGRARTLRFLPHREDLFAEHGTGFNAQKRAVESVGADEVLVMEARGESTSGTIGDILALRAQVRGAAAVVTDGGIRDAAEIAALDIPVHHASNHPAVLGRRHVPWEVDTAIGCGGTTVVPGDVIVGDDDGVLVIPPRLVADVAADAQEQERQETFIAEQVAKGHPIRGLYPLSGEWEAAYQDWLHGRPEGGNR
ncbi:fumarylacetoacetate hydrolase family protein [Haloechinothrix sp. YIM 98757]|uniref:Fumarylacetoacetate hydrolase family protein n=1 Tax=Haloechinothrix aidingensis TaxID=2752311 RepID=A0A838ABJ0_9PSEU|nr:fumarylacetoacetate hydrolase family protein [Haloechinothrix aidingensis]MBA0126610.1 fumarylacetoacetate hydrolase family protein [Haloechinothrix aidingensis]